MKARKYAVSQADVHCTECCVPSVQEPVRRLGELADDEIVYLCQECDALLEAQLREEFGAKS
jgi:hypothetical protein